MKPATPPRNIDEHDIVFARMRLKPGTQDWDQYYSTRPGQLKIDNTFRELPGLLSEKGSQFHPLNFPVADTNFQLIEYLFLLVFRYNYLCTFSYHLIEPSPS